MEYNSLRNVHKRRRNRAAAPIGALVLVLAAAGLCALIMLSINLTHQILDNSREKQRFEKLVQPVLMFDPPPFEDVTTLPDTTVLEAALWATMLGEKRETYAFDAQGNLILPSSDVDVESAKLFGPELSLKHQSFPSDFGISYEYDESSKAYRIPVASATTLYTPRVDEIEREGDIYSLLVGYIPPGTAWNTDITGNKTEPDPHKFMVYKLQKKGRNYQLIAIENPPADKQVSYGPSISSSLNEIASVEEQLSSSSEPSESSSAADDGQDSSDGEAGQEDSSADSSEAQDSSSQEAEDTDE
ncbi:MAG: hypothetical protein HFG27_02670 [Provencibacterium sp.]|jgi:hypothetical protein|nr:hypothetical protein [Provencibacterium sp.]